MGGAGAGELLNKLWYDGDTHNTVKSVAALFVSFINWQKSSSEWFQLGSSRSSESRGNRCFAFSSLSCTNLAADCPAGSYSSVNRTCFLCPRGTYQPSRGWPSCISCGLNLTTQSSGTVDKKHCISKLINSRCNISCGVRHILVYWCIFSLNYPTPIPLA